MRLKFHLIAAIELAIDVVLAVWLADVLGETERWLPITLQVAILSRLIRISFVMEKDKRVMK